MQGQMYWLQGILYIFSFANSTQCTTETWVFLLYSASVVKSNNRCVLWWGKPSIFTARPGDHQYSCFPFNEFRPQRRAWEDIGAFVFMPLIGYISFVPFFHPRLPGSDRRQSESLSNFLEHMDPYGTWIRIYSHDHLSSRWSFDTSIRSPSTVICPSTWLIYVWCKVLHHDRGRRRYTRFSSKIVFTLLLVHFLRFFDAVPYHIVKIIDWYAAVAVIPTFLSSTLFR